MALSLAFFIIGFLIVTATLYPPRGKRPKSPSYGFRKDAVKGLRIPPIDFHKSLIINVKIHHQRRQNSCVTVQHSRGGQSYQQDKIETSTLRHTAFGNFNAKIIKEIVLMNVWMSMKGCLGSPFLLSNDVDVGVDQESGCALGEGGEAIGGEAR